MCNCTLLWFFLRNFKICSLLKMLKVQCNIHKTTVSRFAFPIPGKYASIATGLFVLSGILFHTRQPAFTTLHKVEWF